MKVNSPNQYTIGGQQPEHDFREPSNLLTATDNDPLLIDLIKTRSFQRLRKIRFLGAIDYRRIPHPNGRLGATRYSRYEHSIGVMQLALLYSRCCDLNPTQRSLIGAAALLHDIGHPPLSHSVESVFKEFLEIDHHTASIDIICGRVLRGKEVFQTLRRYGVDIDALLAIISGESTDFHGFFSGPINFDTIEGILRTYRYCRQQDTTPNPATVTQAAILRATERDCALVDEFWTYKNWVYKKIINSREGILSDYVCKVYLRERSADIHREWFFGDEERLFNELPGLKELLTSATFSSDAIRNIDGPIAFVDRNYFVEENGDFFEWQDKDRYQHTRTKLSLQIHRVDECIAVETKEESQKVLFNELTV